MVLLERLFCCAQRATRRRNQAREAAERSSAPVDADAAGHEGDERASDEGGAHKDGGAVLRHAEAAGLAADADGSAAAL